MCTTCEDSGYVTTYERHPYGSTYATETLSEPCPDCLNRDLCPSCGAEGAIVWMSDRYFDRAECRECGWREGTS